MPRITLPAMIAMVALLGFACPLFAAGPKGDFDREISRQRKELSEIRSRLQRGQQELESLKEREESTLGKLELISSNIRLTEKYLSALDSTESTLAKSVGEARAGVAEVEERIRDRNAVMARRVRVLYITGKPDRILLAGFQPGRGDFLRKVFFMKRVLRYDRELVQASRADAAEKRLAVSRLEGRQQETARFRGHKAKEREIFTRAKRQQEKSLATLQSNLESKEAALRELEENSRLITEIIATLEKRRQEARARDKKVTVLETGSKYCLPVEGEIASKYGLHYHATLKTTTKNLGIEIQGKPGAPVRAAVSGEVAMITRIPGYGLGIILDNGSDFFTIYANLASIRVKLGDEIKTCQDIAQVSSEPSRVYFEVRKGTRTLDPVQWLKSSGN